MYLFAGDPILLDDAAAAAADRLHANETHEGFGLTALVLALLLFLLASKQPDY